VGHVAVWVAAVAVQLLLTPVIAAAVVVAGSVYALSRYLNVSWQVLSVRQRDGESPAPAPPSSLAAVPPVAAGATDSPEPAQPVYVLGQVWRDVWVVARRTGTELWAETAAAHRGLLRWTRERDDDGVVMLTGWPTWFGLAAGTALLALPVVVGALALVAVQVCVVAVWSAGWLVAVLGLGLLEHVLRLARRIVVACPHPGCYRRFGLPMYECPAPGCRERHWRLVPNRYGVLRHTCRCGARLPTLILLGRHRLAAYCPHCRLRLPGRSGRVRVEHVPIIGGPDAGKTTFLYRGVISLRSWLAGRAAEVNFVDVRDERAFASAAERLERGERLDKTPVELARAVSLDVRTGTDRGRILYLFDPAGEYYATGPMVDSQRYLEHAEVAVVVVDPLAIPEVRRALSQADRDIVAAAAPANRVGVVPERPGDTVDRFTAALRARPSGRRLRRLLVVVSKSDVLRHTSVGNDPGLRTDPRSWLVDIGWGNWARALDATADGVRYLASGLDLPPDALGEPVAWLAGLGADGTPRAVGRRAAKIRSGPWTATARPGLIPQGYRIGRLALFVIGAVVTTVAVSRVGWFVVSDVLGWYWSFWATLG
jgi:hypothetical protein